MEGRLALCNHLPCLNFTMFLFLNETYTQKKGKRTALEEFGGKVSLIMDLQIVVREKGLNGNCDMTVVKQK